jgi:hypothetical protein
MFAPVFSFFNFANIWTSKNSHKCTVRVENDDSNAIVPIYLTLHVANGHKHHVSAFYHQITPTRVGSGLGTREDRMVLSLFRGWNVSRLLFGWKDRVVILFSV